MHGVATACNVTHRRGDQFCPVIRITPVPPRIESLTFRYVAVLVCKSCQRTQVIGVGIVELAVAVFLYKYCCQAVTSAKVVNFSGLLAKSRTAILLNAYWKYKTYLMTLRKRSFTLLIFLSRITKSARHIHKKSPASPGSLINYNNLLFCLKFEIDYYFVQLRNKQIKAYHLPQPNKN
jgi:hypothetical protein